MITLFSTPKPFIGHFEIIQRNAFESWTYLQPRPEIILFGDEKGTDKTAAEFGLRHVPDVACNEYGTPLLNDIFEKAQKIASHDVLCYVNADIILMSDFIRAIQSVSALKRRFLVVGQRWDLEIKQPLDFSPDWENRLLSLIGGMGKLQENYAMDYFAFSRGMWGEIPPFAIGRMAWDNWLCYRARALSVPVVDATEAVIVVHQNHDYSHLPTKWKNEEKNIDIEDIRRSAEGARNMQFMSGLDYNFTMLDATHKLTKNRRLRPALGPASLKRRLKTIPILRPHTPLARLMNGLIRVYRPAGAAFRKYKASRRSE